MFNILDLPNEIILRILFHCSANEILNFSLVCQRIRSICDVSEVWRSRCLNDYKIHVPLETKFSAKQLYLKLLQPYGRLIGLWQNRISPYGGLLQIKYEDGVLHGNELHVPHPKNISKNLRVKNLFKIGFNDSKTYKLCLDHDCDLHQALISFVNQDAFTFNCSNLSKHRDGKIKDNQFAQFLQDEFQEYSVVDDEYYSLKVQLRMKFLSIYSHGLSYEYQRLYWPTFKRKYPIEPGLFKGEYGAHGLELIMLSYEEDRPRATATKISGDVNIPATQLTFHANLDFPIIGLTLRDQETITSLESIPVMKIKFKDDRILKPQVFRLPENCYSTSSDIPNTCLERFHGWLQLAEVGYRQSFFTKGQWIVFDKNLFGFLWLGESWLNMYHRVDELSYKDSLGY